MRLINENCIKFNSIDEFVFRFLIILTSKLCVLYSITWDFPYFKCTDTDKHQREPKCVRMCMCFDFSLCFVTSLPLPVFFFYLSFYKFRNSFRFFVLLQKQVKMHLEMTVGISIHVHTIDWSFSLCAHFSKKNLMLVQF